jgi:hypothetical protein
MTSCLTQATFVHVVQHSYKPTPTMTLLKKSLDFHSWLEGAFAKHHSCIGLPLQFIFSKNNDVGSTADGVKAIVRCSEWSSSVLGEPTFPLQRLPNQSRGGTQIVPCFSNGKLQKHELPSRSPKRYFKRRRPKSFLKVGNIMIFLLHFKGMRG